MPKVALVRGKYLNQYELQIYTPLTKKYHFTGFGSLTCYHDQFPFPVIKLPSPIDLLSQTQKINLKDRYILAVLNRVTTDAQKLFGLEERLKDFDIAHAADTHYGFTYQCIVAKKKGLVKKVVATIFENIPFNNEGIRGRKETIHDVIENLDHAIAMSKRSKEALLIEGFAEEKITVITQGIDTERFKPKSHPNSNKDAISILFVGRLEWYKGIYDVIYAFAQTKRALPKSIKLNLQIVGKGSEENRLKQLVHRLNLNHEVVFEKSSYHDMPKIYRQADIFIAPSKETPHWQEQFSMALLEAQSASLPIITSYSGAIPENVGDAALMVGPGDILGLKDALSQLILDPKSRYTLGRKARQRAEKYFDIRVIADQIDRVYKKVLS